MKQSRRKEREMVQEFKEKIDPATAQSLYNRKFVMKTIGDEAQSEAPVVKRQMSDEGMSSASTAGGDLAKSQGAAMSAQKTPFSLKSPASIEPISQYKYRDWRDIYQQQ